MIHLFSVRDWLPATPARRAAAPQRFRPALECLESRWTPANITGMVKLGVLTLTADQASAAESLTIIPQVGGPARAFSVVGEGGTTINGDPTHDFARVHSIVIKVKGGDDIATLNTVRLPGNVVFKGGDGTNSFTLQGNARIGGSVLVVNGSNATGFDLVTISATQVGGSVAINNGPGDSITTVAATSVAGGVQVRGRSGNDIVVIGANATIGGSLVTNLGGGVNLTALVDSTISRSLVVTGGGDNDTIHLTDTWVGRRLTALLGNGSNSLAIDDTASGFVSDLGSTVNRALTYVGGSGWDAISCGFERPVTLVGPVAITTGDDVGSGDLVGFDDTFFLSSVLIETGSGNDAVRFEQQDTATNQTTQFGGKLTVRLGSGGDVLRLGVDGQADRKVLFAKAPEAKGGSEADSLFRENYAIAGVDQAPFPAAGFETITPAF